MTIFRPGLFIAFVLTAWIVISGFPTRAAAEGLTPEMKKEVEAIVEDYIDANPEILLDAIETLRQRDAEQRTERAKSGLRAKRDELLNSPHSPTGGNLKGDVTIVEFSDYRCPYCKRMAPIMAKLLKEDGNIRIVYKEYPILGPTSTYAAKAALAAWYTAPDKYEAFHNAILNARGDMTEERILAIADDTGIDSDALEVAMKNPEIDQEIQRNLKLGAELGITGTPSYVVGRELIPGAISYDDMKDYVETARKR